MTGIDKGRGVGSVGDCYRLTTRITPFWSYFPTETDLFVLLSGILSGENVVPEIGTIQMFSIKGKCGTN